MRGYCLVGFNGPGNKLPSLSSEQDQLDAALRALLSMDQQSTVPTMDMCKSLVTLYAKRKKASNQAERVQVHPANRWMESPSCLGEWLVSTLVTCGGLEDAVQVFNRLPQRTVFSLRVLVSGYTMAGRGHEALVLYWRMREEGVDPDNYTLIKLLNACGNIRHLEWGKHIHAEALKRKWACDLFVKTCILDMYAKCGSMVSAQRVFDGLSRPDVVSWNAMLAAYVQQGSENRSVQVYEDMREEGVSPNNRTFVSLLQACGMLAEHEEGNLVGERLVKANALKMVKAVHSDAWTKGLDENLFVSNTLVRVYGKCASIADARHVFDRLFMPDLVSYNAMLAAYVEMDEGETALQLYQQMLEEGMMPDVRTFVSALRACGTAAGNADDSTKKAYLALGKAIHGHARRSCCASDAYVGSTLIWLYGKCHSVIDAWHAFNNVTDRDVVSCNAMLLVCIQQGQVEKAMQLYENMHSERVSPDVQTLLSLLQACGVLAEGEAESPVDGQWTKPTSLAKCKEVHAFAQKKGYHVDAFLTNSLISTYGKCGSLVDAQGLFDGLVIYDLVSCNAMLAAYAQQGRGEEALQFYGKMLETGLSPNEITLRCVLQVCGCRGRLDICRQVHHALPSNKANMTPLLASSLIHAYGRCASMADAQAVFDSFLQPDVVLWTALMAGYARQGHFVTSLQCFQQMQSAGIKPDGVAFLSVLSACSHSGEVCKGLEYFESMTKEYELTPAIEHYATMADLLGRAGHWRAVEELLCTMPKRPDLAMWLGLLGVCRSQSQVTLGKMAFDHAVRLQPNHAAAYVLMSNVYADAGLWDRAKVLREEAGEWKKVGRSWIEHQQAAHTFVVGDMQHSQGEEVFNFIHLMNLQLYHEHFRWGNFSALVMQQGLLPSPSVACFRSHLFNSSTHCLPARATNENPHTLLMYA